jgi:hypothetical protein
MTSADPAGAAEPTFRDDVRASLVAWRQAPALPILYVVLAVVAVLPAVVRDQQAAGGVSVLLLPVALFAIGFRATTRIWYLRVWQGEPMPAGEVWSVSWRLLGRMFVLGLIIIVPWLVLTGVFYAAVHPAGFSNLTTFSIAAGATSFIADVVLTFVVPALIYSTTRAAEACRLGISMLRMHHRQAALYVLTPPLALLALSRLLANATPNRGLYVLIQIAVALLDLMFKGAIAAYYLRHAPGHIYAAARHGPYDEPAMWTPQEGARERA